MFTAPLLITSVLALAVSRASATFTLNVPTAAGTDPSAEENQPCGGFEVTTDAEFWNYPTGGHDVKLTDINDTDSIFSFRIALLSDQAHSVQLYPDVHSSIQGELCISRIRAEHIDHSWYGEPAVIQVQQYIGGGVTNFQCAPVKLNYGEQANPYCRKEPVHKKVAGSE
ncbi:hypothetical protein F4778DRAFT_785993 [Xylariomycetidae sp. FL2044]|nr:hypothetical protein F4778DRAFT_785993 [Xylariomycetidae sp. FL2044]